MSKTAMTSNDLIDALIRTTFSIEPAVMASLSHGDDQVRLRLLPGMETSSDPLDGLDVFLRRTVAAAVAMREHHAAVSLVTERQARAAGWPTARTANLSLILAWAMFINEPARALPVLLEADEEAEAHVSPLVGADDRLPSLEMLLAILGQSRQIDIAAMEQSARARQNAPAVHDRKLVQLGELLQRWLGADAGAVELPADRWTPRESNCNARAVGVFSWIAFNAVDLGLLLQEERTMVVRLKTDRDAALAGEPGATAANLALLLGAAANHAAGVTLHFLAPKPDFAAALVEAGRQIESRYRQPAEDQEAETVQVLELEDLAGRGYIHVGRRAAERVARRLFREATGEAVARTRLLAGETTR